MPAAVVGCGSSWICVGLAPKSRNRELKSKEPGVLYLKRFSLIRGTEEHSESALRGIPRYLI